MKVVNINGVARAATGKKATKAVRKEGKIPAIIYGDRENIHFSTTHQDVKSIVYTPEFKIAAIDVDGVAYRCVLKDTQFHPVSEQILHLDFLRLTEGETIKLDVPVKFIGNSPGVKEGGKLQQNLRRITIKTTPENMVDTVVLDISELKLGHSIRVRDIQAIEGVEVMNPPGTPVASVEIPRALRSATAAEEEEAAAATATEEE